MINTDALLKKPTLLGDRVRLVPLEARHAVPMWLATNDPGNRRLTGTRQEFTLDAIRQWCTTRAHQDDRLDLAIESTAPGGQFLGELALNDLDAVNDAINFRIALQPGYAGQGLGVEATRLVLRHAFEEANLHRVQLEVFDFNPRAIRAYEKAGFTHEGRSRQALLWDGERHDVLHMAALRDEWLATQSPSSSPSP